MAILNITFPYNNLGSFPGGLAGKEPTCNEGDLGSIPGLGISPGEGNGYPAPVFWPGEPHGLQSLIQLSEFPFPCRNNPACISPSQSLFFRELELIYLVPRII